MNTLYEVNSLVNTAITALTERWITEELFSPSWLTILGGMAVIYIILFLFIDRKRLRELFFYGSLLAVSFGYIDVVGTNHGFWAYKTHFLPLISSLFPYTYTVHPIVHMLAYQYGDSWSKFAVTNTIATAFFAFIAQPFYLWSGVLWLENWNFVYSFLLALFTTNVARAFVLWLARVEQRHATETHRAAVFPVLSPAMKPEDKDKE